MSNPARSEEDITAGLLMLIAWAGNASAAVRALKASGRLDITSGTLTSWAKERYPDRYDELRSKYQDKMESQLVHEYRDVARTSVEVQRLALQRAREKLEAGKDNDPSRTAANAATVAEKMTRQTLNLSGRPTTITETRDVGEIIRGLVARGVLELPPEAVTEEPSKPQIEAAQQER